MSGHTDMSTQKMSQQAFTWTGTCTVGSQTASTKAPRPQLTKPMPLPRTEFLTVHLIHELNESLARAMRDRTLAGAWGSPQQGSLQQRHKETHTTPLSRSARLEYLEPCTVLGTGHTTQNVSSPGIELSGLLGRPPKSQLAQTGSWVRTAQERDHRSRTHQTSTS